MSLPAFHFKRSFCSRAIWASLLTAAIVGGCQKPLFPKDSPRNQYQTYDRMRNKDAPLTEPDVFGNPQPALRARLSQSS